jgi:hypothetical protein
VFKGSSSFNDAAKKKNRKLNNFILVFTSINSNAPQNAGITLPLRLLLVTPTLHTPLPLQPPDFGWLLCVNGQSVAVYGQDVFFLSLIFVN